MVANAELDNLSLSDLADRLANVRSTRTHEGFGMENAVTKSSLERRIMEKVLRHESSDSTRLVIDHPIVLKAGGKTIEADIAEIRTGGLCIPGDAQKFEAGTDGVLEVRSENDYPMRVKCVIRESIAGDTGVSISFEGRDGSNERRVNRLILELLKNQAS